MAKSWLEDRANYQALADKITPTSILQLKQGLLWSSASWLLFLASFGRLSRQRFLEDFATTLGPIQAYPEHWTELSRHLIVHECRHTRQFLFAGWCVPVAGWLGQRVRVWVGIAPMALIYGLFPVPLFFAWGRMRLELDADAYAWRIGLQEGWLTPAEVRSRAERFAQTVSSWAYLKAWPRAWTQRTFLKRAEAEIQSWADRGNSSVC